MGKGICWSQLVISMSSRHAILNILKFWNFLKNPSQCNVQYHSGLNDPEGSFQGIRPSIYVLTGWYDDNPPKSSHNSNLRGEGIFITDLHFQYSLKSYQYWICWLWPFLNVGHYCHYQYGHMMAISMGMVGDFLKSTENIDQ